MDTLLKNYNLLISNIINLNDSDPNKGNALKRLSLLQNEINYLNHVTEQFIDDINRQRFDLNQSELKQIEENDIMLRSIDKIKPLLYIMTCLIEQ
jgi:hypothetical protein